MSAEVLTWRVMQQNTHQANVVSSVKTTARASSGSLPQKEATTENENLDHGPQICACATQQHLSYTSLVI